MFLKSSSVIWLSFLTVLVSARLLVSQCFKMDFGEESEVEVSSRDSEGEFSVFRIFLKKCCIVLYEMLHSFGHPSVKHDQTTCSNVRQMLYDVL